MTATSVPTTSPPQVEVMSTRRNRGSFKQSNSNELDNVTTFTRNKPDNNTNDILNFRDSGTSSYYSFSDLHHESDAPASSSRRDRDKGKAVDRSYSGSSRRDRDVSTDDTRRNKHQDRADKHVYSGPLAHAEFERMRNEIDALKKALQEYKKTAKKQNKKIEDLKSQLLSETQTRQSHEAQIQTIKTKYEKHEDLITTIETSLQCQICMDLLQKPFALSPCGHILCLVCLQQWFRQAPPSVDDMDVDLDLDLASDPHYILTRDKSCPCCRAIVRRRPVPVFLVKAVVGAVAKARSGNSNINNPCNPGGSSGESGAILLDEEDPWKGIFVSDDDGDDGESSDNEYDEDDEDEDEDEDSDDSGEDHVTWSNIESGIPGPFRLGSEASSTGGSDVEDEDEDEDNDRDEGEGDSADDEGDFEIHPHDSGTRYIPARWEPPTVSIELSDLSRRSSEYLHPHDSSSLLNMLRRGCPYSMIRKFQMSYSHRRGLVAYLPSLDERSVPALYSWHSVSTEQDSDARARNSCRAFLGWNIRTLGDVDGRAYMRGVLREVKQPHNRKWKVEPRPGYPGAFDVKRLVRAEDMEEWDTTDTEAWVEGRDESGSGSDEGEGDGD